MATVHTGPPRDLLQSGAEARRDPSDQALLECFVARGDEAAFAGLVRRHSKTVWNVCWRVLRQEQDVEDAFQAVFVVLARKAASIRTGEAVGSWLYGVAYRTAMKARRSAASRQKHERQAGRSGTQKAEPPAEAAYRELQRVVDAEVQRLAANLRAPFVLCCLEGMSRSEAARELKCTEGTLSGRLARARIILQKRLARRGVVLSAVLASVALAESTGFAAAGPILIPATIQGALATLTGSEATGVSLSALRLAEAVSHSVGAARLNTVLAFLVALALVITGGSLVALQLTVAVELADPDTFVGPPVVLGTPVDEQVASVAFSPDGTRLVTAGGQHALPGQLQIWDVKTRQNLVTIRGIPAVRSVAFAPDGQTFATGDSRGYIRVRDAATGQEREAVKGHDNVSSIAYSADGKWLVSAGMDRSVKLWHAKGLKEHKSFRHNDKVLSAAFCRHGRGILSSCQDKTVTLWDADDGSSVPLHPCEVLAVSPDDKLWAMAATFGSLVPPTPGAIKLAELDSGKEIGVLEGQTSSVSSLAFSPDAKLLAGAMADGTIGLWDVKTHKLVQRLEKHAGTIWTLAFSHDGTLLASGSADKTAKLWQIPGGKEAAKLVTLSPVIKPIQALAYAPDSTSVAMATNDGVVQIRDSKTGDVLKLLYGHTGEVNCLAFAPDGATLASGSSDRTVRLWTLATGETKQTLKHGSEVYALAFTPDGKRLASAGGDQTISGQGPRAATRIRLWHLASGNAAELGGHDKPIRALAVTADGRRLISGSEDTTINVWDLADLGKAPLTLKGHTGAVRALVTANDGTLASAGEDGTVKLWDIGQGKERLTLRGHRDAVLSLAVTPTGRTLVSGSRDKTVGVWNMASGELRGLLMGHQGAVTALAVHPRGTHLISGGLDTWLFRWRGVKQPADAVDDTARRPKAEKTTLVPVKPADVVSTPNQEHVADVQIKDADPTQDPNDTAAADWTGWKTWLGLSLITVLASGLWLAVRRSRRKQQEPGRLSRRVWVSGLACLTLLAAGTTLWLAFGDRESNSEATSGVYQDFRGSRRPVPPFYLDGVDAQTRAETGGLRISLPATRRQPSWKAVGVVPSFELCGDFEITGSYELLSSERPPPGNGVGVALWLSGATHNAGRFAAIGRFLSAGPGDGNFYVAQHWVKDPKMRGKLEPTAARAGKLRFTRQGSILRFLVADGDSNEFREITRTDFGTGDLVTRFVVNNDSRPTAVDARLVDLKIRAASLTPDAPPPDADQASETQAPEIAWKRWLALGLVLTVALGLALALRQSHRAGKTMHAIATSEAAGNEHARPEAAPVSFPCPGCGTKLQAKSALAGKTVKCPRCARAVIIPDSAADFILHEEA